MSITIILCQLFNFSVLIFGLVILILTLAGKTSSNYALDITMSSSIILSILLSPKITNRLLSS